MNENIVETIFPGTIDKIQEGICPFCNNKVGDFNDELSKKEYNISGLCQTCQNKVFG